MAESLQKVLVIAIFVASVVGFISTFLALKKPKMQKLELLVMIITSVLALLLIAIRFSISAYIPMANGFEFAMWLLLTITLFSAFLIERLKLQAVGLITWPLMAGICLWMLNLDMSVNPLPPALRSIWLTFHVSTAIIAYASFTISFATSVLVVLKKQKDALPEIKALDHISHKLVLIGLSFQTIMIILGAVWAEYAWGNYWSWDPKETWALITWLIYALYLHLRLRGWKGQKAAYINIVGFLAVIFTFFGVSYLLPGLHSYI